MVGRWRCWGVSSGGERCLCESGGGGGGALLV